MRFLLCCFCLVSGWCFGQVPRVPGPAMAVFHVKDSAAFWRGWTNSALCHPLLIPQMFGLRSNVFCSFLGSPASLPFSSAARDSSSWTLWIPQSATAENWKSSWVGCFSGLGTNQVVEVPGLYSERVGDRLVVGTTSHCVGEAKGLWRNEFLSAEVSATLLKEADFVFWWDMATWSNVGTGFVGPEWGAMLQQLGLRDVQAITVSGRFGTNGTQLRLAVVSRGAVLTGLLGVLAPLPGAVEPPAAVPLSVMDYGRARWDLPRIVESFGTAMWGARCMDQPLLMSATGRRGVTSSVSVRDGFLRFLGTDVMFWRFRPKGADAVALARCPEVLFIGSDDPESLLSGVRALLSRQFGLGLTFSEKAVAKGSVLEGAKLLHVESLGPGVRLWIGGSECELLAGRGGLWIASSLDLLETVWQPVAAPLGGSQSVNAAVKRLGGWYGSMYVANHKAYARSWWSIVSSLPGDATGLAFPGFEVDLPKWFDVQAFPDFEVIADCFSFGAASLSARGNVLQVDYLSP